MHERVSDHDLPCYTLLRILSGDDRSVLSRAVNHTQDGPRGNDLSLRWCLELLESERHVCRIDPRQQSAAEVSGELLRLRSTSLTGVSEALRQENLAQGAGLWLAAAYGPLEQRGLWLIEILCPDETSKDASPLVFAAILPRERVFAAALITEAEGGEACLWKQYGVGSDARGVPVRVLPLWPGTAEYSFGKRELYRPSRLYGASGAHPQPKRSDSTPHVTVIPKRREPAPQPTPQPAPLPTATGNIRHWRYAWNGAMQSGYRSWRTAAEMASYGVMILTILLGSQIIREVGSLMDGNDSVATLTGILFAFLAVATVGSTLVDLSIGGIAGGIATEFVIDGQQNLYLVDWERIALARDAFATGGFRLKKYERVRVGKHSHESPRFAEVVEIADQLHAVQTMCENNSLDRTAWRVLQVESVNRGRFNVKVKLVSQAPWENRPQRRTYRIPLDYVGIDGLEAELRSRVGKDQK